jgi:hypothetical protein
MSTRNPQPQTLAELEKVGTILRESVPGTGKTTAGGIHAATLSGRCFGDVWAAADFCYIINSTAKLNAEGRRALLYTHGVRVEIVETTTERAHLRAAREGVGVYEAEWTIARAEKLGYRKPAKEGKQDGRWYTDPKGMLLARAWTEVHSQLAPDLGGLDTDEPTTEEVSTVLQEATIVPGTRITSRFADPAPAAADPTPALAVSTYTPPADVDEAVSRFVVMASEIGHDDDAAIAAAVAKMREKPDVCIAYVAAREQEVPEVQAQKIGALLAKYATPAAEPVAATIQPALVVADPAPTVADQAPAAPRAEKPGARIVQLIGEALVYGGVEWDTGPDDPDGAKAEQRVQNYVKNLTAAERKALCDRLESASDDAAAQIATIPGLRLPR